jgi:heat shock protein HslJ
MRLLVLLCALPVLALAACGTVAGTGGQAVGGRTFLSTGVTEDGRPRELVDGSRVTLAFEEGRLRASAGCNTMGGNYRLDGRSLVTDQLAMTEMGCPPALMDQDTWLADLLTSRPTLDLDGDELTLTSGPTVLSLLDRVVADPDRPLVGTTWRVDSLVTGEAVSSTPGEAQATLTFREDGTVEVMAGCNRGRGTWVEGDGTVTLSGIALTRMACSGDRAELEEAVLRVLQAGELEVRITAASLQLLAGDLGLGLRAE